MYVYAKCSTSLRSGIRLVEGEIWTAEDPVVKANPTLFTVTPPRVRSSTATSQRADKPVERATAAPGEKRKTVR